MASRLRRHTPDVALVAALTIGFSLWLQLGAGSPVALAVCTDSHQNILGVDSSFFGYGNRSDILVNDIQYSQLDESIHRSLFVYGPGPADVEVGWTGNNGGQDAPRSYFEFVTGSGSDSGPRFGPNVQAGNYPNYKITAPDPPNQAGNYRWTAYRNSVSFDSVVLGFNRGELHTNSERRNTCDTWYADFKSLDNCRTVSSGSCNWNGSYLNLQCHRTDGDGTYKFDKVSNSHHYVRTGSGVTC